MDQFDPSTIGCATRKKRSDTPRRPRTNTITIPSCYDCSPNEHNFTSSKRHIEDTGGFGDDNTFSTSRDEKKLKRVKLKLGGVTRTIHAIHATDGLPTNCYNSLDARQCPNIQGLESGTVRKSKRIPKIRVLDVGYSDDEEKDAEIRYLERLNASKVKSMNINWLSTVGTYGVKARSHKAYEDEDYMEEDEPLSDDGLEVERKTLRKDSTDLLRGESNETLDHSANHKDEFLGTSNTVELLTPTGSLSVSRKKQKLKLSEVEQQLKKAEAAQRRKLQSENAAREAEAEAIRKILGQDSARRKREEKKKKQRDEAAQGKAGNSMKLAPGTVRWVMGPTGTVVTFSEDLGLPSLFDSQSCSYPAVRGKCAAPNCTNPYKYRDSKSKLPLCSLICYREIHKESQHFTPS